MNSRPRLHLLLGSPRVAPGLLSREAWRVLESAALVLASSVADPAPRAIAEAGIPVEEISAAGGAAELASLLTERARTCRGDVVWVHGPDGDPGLMDALAARLTALDDPLAVELLVGSWDVPGARLLDVVAVMDRLRSPGGCPWDARQTHESLLRYLTEESEEYAEAVRSGDRRHMAEELGDVLLQVVFHARVAEDDAQEPFDIDDVAGGLVAKLVRRHPHVFADVEATTVEEVETNWARIKEQERSAPG